jgi:uncharacterized protein YcbK (DUF882 family)
LLVALNGRPWTASKRVGRALLGLSAALVALLGWARGTQDAAAYGDTRILSIVHAHTNESATVTFRRNGRYDSEALSQLNWLLRDWRLDQKTTMEPRLFDILWEVYRESGSREPIVVLSAYRAPQTNAMLRRRSRGVSEHSQHMVGKAMDFRLTDVDMPRVRAIAMRLQHGGVGYYGVSGFLHIDVGSVRAWPRMTYEQLARLFPDGKTVHLPPNGKPLARYEEARAEILARGGAVKSYEPAGGDDGAGGRRSLWAMLFGGADEDSEYYNSTERSRPPGFRLPWQRAPEAAQTPPQPAQEPASTVLAFAPMPPRRPDEITGTTLALAPLPPTRPVEFASLRGSVPDMAPRPGPAPEDRAALRALFVAAASRAEAAPAPRIATSRARPEPVAPGGLLAELGPALNLGFSPTPPADLTTVAFTGPAVKPLPVLR